jgi:hypothetical protein
MEGVVELQAGYKETSATNPAAVGDVVCMSTTQYVIQDCTTGPQLNILGIASSAAVTGTNAGISVVTTGEMVVKLSTALTAIGDTVCMGTSTAGQAVDSGGQGACPTAYTNIGVIIADSGQVYTAGGSGGVAAQTLSTTLPLVELHIGK